MTVQQTEMTKPGLVKKTEELSDKRVPSHVRKERSRGVCSGLVVMVRSRLPPDLKELRYLLTPALLTSFW